MALKDWIGPIASGIGSVLGFGGSMYANQQNAAENEKNRQWNERMWNLSNQYNLPVNMMQRLRDARINPMLAVTDASGTLSSYAGNLGTQRAFENPMNSVNLSDAFRLQNESKVAESQVKLNEAEAYRNTAEGNRIATENEYLPERLKHEISILGYEDSIKNIEEFVKQQTYNQEIEIIVQQAQQEILSTETAREQKKIVVQQLNNLIEEYNNLVKQGKVLEAEELLKKEAVKTEQTAQTKNLADAYYSKVKASVVPSEIALNRANARKSIAEAIKAGSDKKLNDAQIYKIANDVEEQLYNGNTKRALDIMQVYGSSVIGAVERNFTQPIKSRARGMRAVQRRGPVGYLKHYKR